MKKNPDMQKQLKDSAYKVWLAGLGAFAVASEEGKSLFKTLVEKGQELEERSTEQVDKVKGKLEDARSNATMMWDRIQEGVDEQIASALHRLGVPTREEIATLTRRVEELTRSIDRTRAKAAATPRPRKTAKASPKPSATT